MARGVINDSKAVNLNRQLQGTAFLSLEHWAYMTLVVLLPILLLMGFKTALAMWMNQPLPEAMILSPHGVLDIAMTSYLGAPMATGISAALLVLAPLLFVLRRRTQAEMAKRSGYEQRTAYKLPIYGALALLAVLKVGAVIALVCILLQVITLLGVQGVDAWAIYAPRFFLALVAAAIFGLTGWYVFKLAKGVNLSYKFTFVIVWAAALMMVMLLTTAIMANQNQNNDRGRSPYYSQPMPQPYWRE